MRYLGIYIGNNKAINSTKNWEDKLQEISSILESWKTRDLSLFGKVLIIKTLAVSKIVLAASLLQVPQNFVDRLNTILFTFIWGRRDKVSRKKVIKKVTEGGLNMVDIECLFSSFKAYWLKRILSCDCQNESWAQIPLYYLNTFVSNDIVLKLNINKKKTLTCLENFPQFWKEVILCFSQTNDCTIEEFKESIYLQQI